MLGKQYILQNNEPFALLTIETHKLVKTIDFSIIDTCRTTRVLANTAVGNLIHDAALTKHLDVRLNSYYVAGLISFALNDYHIAYNYFEKAVGPKLDQSIAYNMMAMMVKEKAYFPELTDEIRHIELTRLRRAALVGGKIEQAESLSKHHLPESAISVERSAAKRPSPTSLEEEAAITRAATAPVLPCATFPRAEASTSSAKRARGCNKEAPQEEPTPQAGPGTLTFVNG